MKKSLLPILICLVLINCGGHQVTCPDFDEEILNWVPYQANDVIELYSLLKDSSISFSVSNVKITHTTHYITGTDCGKCYDRIEINHYNSVFHIYIHLSKNKIDTQNYHIYDTWFTSNTSSELKSFLFEGKEYDVVRVFEKTDSEGSFQKLIIAKDIGVIGLIDIDGNTWVLKTNGQIKRLDDSDEPEEKPRNIVINNVSC